jgi:hypothetical protein
MACESTVTFFWLWLWVAPVAAVTSGCGGEGGQTRGSCGKVEPCGGDVVGNWKAAGSCFDPAAVLAQLGNEVGIDCPAGAMMTMTSSTLDRTISATFAAEGTYAGMSATTGTLAFDVPRACVVGRTCADLDGALAPLIQPGVIFDAASCTGDTTCSCSITENLGDTQSGTYTVSGSVLETMPSTASVATRTNYCVSGNLMHFINVDPAPPPGSSPPPTIISDVLLERQ